MIARISLIIWLRCRHVVHFQVITKWIRQKCFQIDNTLLFYACRRERRNMDEKETLLKTSDMYVNVGK